MRTLIKLLIIVFIFALSANTIAQKKTPNQILSFKILKQKHLQGIKNEYIYEVTKTNASIENKNKHFVGVDGNYNLKDFEFLPIATLSDNDWTKLKNITDSLLGDIVAKTPKTWDYIDDISIYIRSDMRGIIKDVTFVFPAAINFPIDKIEVLETFIKKELKLNFKINHTNQNANFMSMNYGVEFEPMRQKRINKPMSVK